MTVTPQKSSKTTVATPAEEYRIALTREDINQLPMQAYEGAIRLVRTEQEARQAVVALQQEPVLGFDTETRPSFRKGEFYLPSLVQLAGVSEVVLFQLPPGHIFKALKRLLANGKVLKTGVSLDYDVKQLCALDAFVPAGFTPLEPLARAQRIKNQGLRGLTAALLGFRISKKAQCSNWSRTQLTPAQIQYAATDAWVSLALYQKLTAAPAPDGECE